MHLQQHATNYHLQSTLVIFATTLTNIATILQLHLQLITFSSYILGLFSPQSCPYVP